MRAIFGCSFAGLLVLAATAAAQYPPYQNGYGGYPGAPYGGGQQYGGAPYGGSPLSPYLNLRGGVNGTSNPAVNYYNFVRPNLPNVNRMGGFNPGATGWGAKPNYFPSLQSLDEEGIPNPQRTGVKDKDGNEHVKLPPTGHQAAYQNTLGYYGAMAPTGGVAGSAGRGATGTPGRIR